MKTTKKFIVALLTVTLIFVLFSCDNESHVHTFSEDWTKDETYHYHKATCEHTEEVSEKAEHIFKEVTVEPEGTNEGKKSNVCTVCGYERDVTYLLYGNGIETLVGKGGNICLMNDLALDESLTVEKDVTINLNGKKITYNPSESNTERLFDISKGASLTIIDESATSSGKIECKSKTSLGLFDVSGNLTIKGGNFETAGSTKKNGDTRGAIVFGKESGTIIIGSGSFYASGFDAAVYSKGKLVINDGIFKSNSHYESGDNANKYQYAVSVSGGEATINGGTVSGIHGAVAVTNGKCTINNVKASTFNKIESDETEKSSFHALYVAGEVGKVEAVIKCGTFTSVKGQAAYIGNNTAGDGGNRETASVTIEGGQFTASSSSTNDITYSPATTTEKDGFLAIKGGWYKNQKVGVQNSSTVTIESLLDGYKVEKDGDWYKVTAKTE